MTVTAVSEHVPGDISIPEIPKELRHYIAFSEGQLLVAEGQAANPKIFSYEDRLSKLLGARVPRQLVSMQQIVSLNKDSRRNQSNTATINDAIKLFAVGCERNASDIRIRVYGDYAQVLMRVNGDLRPYTQWEEKYAAAICHAIYTSMADVAEQMFQPTTFQDARIAKPEMLPKGLYGIRLSSGPHSEGCFMVMRLLYESSQVSNTSPVDERLKWLGYSSKHVRAIQFLANRPTGVTIISGPTGSGKSTTLKHTLEGVTLARPELCVMSVEDPPEYPMSGVLQLPVSVGANSSAREEAFGKAIRSAMRSDPDVIMVGEIRDQESARLAMRAAMTGHQVWTTLHANSAFNIINRLCDIMVSPEMPDPLKFLADITVLSGLVFQRLVKTLCPKCKVSFKENKKDLPEGLFHRLSRVVDLVEDGDNIYLRGPGCDYCSNGVQGRTVISEVVATDPKLLELLRNEGVSAARHHWLTVQEGKTYLQHAIEKIRQGILDPRMAEAVAGPLTTDLVFRDGSLEQAEYEML